VRLARDVEVEQRLRAPEPPAAERARLDRPWSPAAVLALQRAAGNALTRTLLQREEGDGKESTDDTKDDKGAIDKLVEEIEKLIDVVEVNYLPVAPAKQYLANRFERLRDELQARADEWNEGAVTGARRIARFRAALEHPDALPLLRRTRIELRESFLEEEGAIGWKPKVPTTGTLLEQLRSVFQQATVARKPVRFLHIRAAINSADDEERQEAAEDEELLNAAREWMAPPGHMVPEGDLPNDFPEFVTSLGVKQQGKVTPYDETEVDDAIRSELGSWVGKRVRDGVEIPGHVTVLDKRNLKTAAAKYTIQLPGGGAVNAFTEGGNIFLGASSGEPSTIVHEGIHLYAEGSFRKAFGDDFDEGVTEYFARIVAGNVFGDARTTKYATQFDAAKVVIDALTDDAVARAYFGGSVDFMQGQFLNVRRIRHGQTKMPRALEDWASFQQLLRDKKYTAAHELIS
jgi:hypothetical protein